MAFTSVHVINGGVHKRLVSADAIIIMETVKLTDLFRNALA